MVSDIDDLNYLPDELVESFFNELYETEDVGLQYQSIQLSPYPSRKMVHENVVKSLLKETGAKFRRRIFRPRGGEIDNNAAINSVQCKRQLRRRSTKAMLYAFPSFDRCDSLLFLPSTIMTHLNKSDLSSLSKLFHAYMDKNCSIQISYMGDETLNVTSLIKFHTLLDELNPDSIVCVHTTKVVENQILASAYTKYTASKTIYDSVARSVTDPLFLPMFGLQRDASIIRSIKRESRSDAEKTQLSNIIHAAESGCDLQLYLRLDLVFTFDDFTKKVTHYQVTEQLTSIKPVQVVPCEEMMFDECLFDEILDHRFLPSS